MITGKISSLPISIVKVKTKVENQLYPAKLAYGPTASIPGPMLDIQDKAAVKLLAKPWVGASAPKSVIYCACVVPLIGSKERIRVTVNKRNK